LRCKGILGIFIVFILLANVTCSKESSNFLEEDTLHIDARLGIGQLVILIGNISSPDKKPYYCEFSIQDKLEKLIIQDTIIKFDSLRKSEYTTLPVNLNSGHFILKSCAVSDSMHKLLYETSSTLSNSTEFKIEKNRVTLLEPSWIAVNLTDSFYIYAYYFDSIANKYMHTSAFISLSNQGNVFYEETLFANMASIQIPQEYNYIIVNVIKPTFKTYRDSLIRSKLSIFSRIYPYSVFLVQ
jgi:hypothetical protein